MHWMGAKPHHKGTSSGAEGLGATVIYFTQRELDMAANSPVHDTTFLQGSNADWGYSRG